MEDHVIKASDGGWVETSIHLRISETVGYVVGCGATAVITGNPGIGKSTSLRALNKVDDKAVMIEFAPRYRTMKGLHKAFLDALGYPSFYRSSFEMEEKAENEAAELAKYNGYLMIDEFQNFDLEAIRGILRFSDHYRLPIVLVGNLTRMRRMKADMHTYNQISDRIWKEVALPAPTREDFLAFAAAYEVDGSDAWDLLIEIGSRTTIRHLTHVLQTARLEQGEGSLKAANLRAAEAFISGGSRPLRQ